MTLAQLRETAVVRRFGLRDGNGLVFVSRAGDVYPSRALVQIYRRSPIFRHLRDEERLQGKCELCPYRSICGGSRARAHALSGDMMASDPWCLFTPWRAD